MNIIYLTSSGNKSGGTRQALYLAKGMEERGHTVRFFVPKKSSLPNLDPAWPGWRFLGPEKTWRASLEEAIRSFQGPCVVHAFHNAAVKRLSWWGLFWKKRAVCVAHRGVIFRPNNPLPYWSPGIDAFLVNSTACGDILRGVGLSKRRILVVSNAVPDERIIPTQGRADIRAGMGMAAEDLVFGTVADSSPVKAVDKLLEAFAGAFPGKAPEQAAQDAAQPARAVRLLIQGANPSVCPDQIKALPVMQRVHFVPHGENIADSLAAMDCFVLPSLSESMPNTLLEALRAGLPAIGTRVGAVPEIIASCGLCVPPGDIPALAQALSRMAADTALRESLTEAARLQGDAYRPERRLDQVEGIYTNLLRAKKFTA